MAVVKSEPWEELVKHVSKESKLQANDLIKFTAEHRKPVHFACTDAVFWNVLAWSCNHADVDSCRVHSGDEGFRREDALRLQYEAVLAQVDKSRAGCATWTSSTQLR